MELRVPVVCTTCRDEKSTAMWIICMASPTDRHRLVGGAGAHFLSEVGGEGPRELEVNPRATNTKHETKGTLELTGTRN